MSENKLEGISIPVLEETTYDQSKEVKKSLDGISAPVLEEPEYTSTNQKRGGLESISAPALEDDGYNNTSQKQTKEQSLEQISAPVLEEQAFTNTNVNTSEREKALEQSVTEVTLEQQEPKKTEYKSQFVDPDLEKAKEEGRKKAIKSAVTQTSTNIDKEKSREMYRQLMAERQAEQAKKGAKIVVVLLIMAIFMSVGLYLFVNLKPFANADEVTLYSKISNVLTYYSIGTAIIGFLMLLRSEGIKKLASGIYGLTTLLMLYPGIGMLMTKERSDFMVNFILYIVTIALSGVICFILCTSEPVDMYYKRREDNI